MNKRFDPQLWAENDEKARTAVKNLFKDSEYRILDNKAKRGVDLLGYKNNELAFHVETEIKQAWKDKEFPYKTVQIPERKRKYAVLGTKPTYFVMFNKDQTSYLVIRDADLLASPVVEVPNRYVYQGEKFFQVPIEKVQFNTIKEIK